MEVKSTSLQVFLGFVTFIGILLCGTDGPAFPVPNIIGMGLVVVCAIIILK